MAAALARTVRRQHEATHCCSHAVCIILYRSVDNYISSSLPPSRLHRNPNLPLNLHTDMSQPPPYSSKPYSPSPPPRENPDRRPLPPGWIAQWDSKCVPGVLSTRPQLTHGLVQLQRMVRNASGLPNSLSSLGVGSMSTHKRIRHDRRGFTRSGHLARPLLPLPMHRRLGLRRQIVAAHTAQATAALPCRDHSDTTATRRPQATVVLPQDMAARLQATTLRDRDMVVLPRLSATTEVSLIVNRSDPDR